jgi:hypothetical protein
MKIQHRELTKNLTWQQICDRKGKIFKLANSSSNKRFIPICGSILYIGGESTRVATALEYIWEHDLFDEVDESFSIGLNDLTITFKQIAA